MFFFVIFGTFRIIFYRFTMRVNTKQLYFVFMSIALKINASPVTYNDGPARGIETPDDEMLLPPPDWGFTTRGKKYLVLK